MCCFFGIRVAGVSLDVPEWPIHCRLYRNATIWQPYVSAVICCNKVEMMTQQRVHGWFRRWTSESYYRQASRIVASSSSSVPQFYVSFSKTGATVENELVIGCIDRSRVRTLALCRTLRRRTNIMVEPILDRTIGNKY